MKPGSISSAIFGLACVATMWQSAQILGTGLWGWAFLAVGCFVAVGPYVAALRGPARAVALVFGILAFLAVALGLLAATIGGSFRLPDDQALLLVTFCVVGVFGIVVFKVLRSERSPA